MLLTVVGAGQNPLKGRSVNWLHFAIQQNSKLKRITTAAFMSDDDDEIAYFTVR